MSTDIKPNPSRRPRLFRNWISLAGLIVIVGSVFSFVLLMMQDLLASGQNLYVGILTWVVAPAFFLFGALLMGVGRYLSRRQLARRSETAQKATLVIDLTSRRHRRYLVAILACAVVFLLVSAVGSYQTYKMTGSAEFCGQACHAPMEPQYVAYQHSPHAQVECTHCHIGSGAANFVKAKFNGIHQLFATVRGNFDRPVHMRGGIPINQQTCEQCHWPDRYIGNVERTYHHFLADDSNSTFSVRLLLKVGGADPTHGPVGGIHWHMNLANKVEYIATDDLRQKIPWVRITDANGKVTEFRSPDFKDDPARHTLRSMDCMDCHNRPAHQLRTPNDAVDLAMLVGKISTNLPAVKREAVVALTGATEARDEGLQKIADHLKKAYPGRPELEQTVAAVQDIYRKNFFPEMKTDWRTHPNNIGHKDWAGCFRCHDGLHKTSDGKKTLGASDCNSCHTILAQGTGGDFEKLNVKGHDFFHVDAPYSDFSCNNCHTGATPKE